MRDTGVSSRRSFWLTLNSTAASATRRKAIDLMSFAFAPTSYAAVAGFGSGAINWRD